MSILLISIFKPFEFNIVLNIIKASLLELPSVIILFNKSFLFELFFFFFPLIRRLSLILIIHFLNQWLYLN